MNCSDGIRRSRKGERMARSEPKVAQPSEVGEARERDLRPAGRSVSFTEAFRFWVKLGFISFGGPAGQIAIMHRELVERRRWLSEERFLHALIYCMLLPGPEAQQLAIYIGWLLHKTRGGLVAGTLFVLPGFFGLKAAVLAIVIQAVVRVGSRALRNNVLRGLAAAAFVAIFVLRVPFPLIVLTAGL